MSGCLTQHYNNPENGMYKTKIMCSGLCLPRTGLPNNPVTVIFNPAYFSVTVKILNQLLCCKQLIYIELLPLRNKEANLEQPE